MAALVLNARQAVSFRNKWCAGCWQCCSWNPGAVSSCIPGTVTPAPACSACLAGRLPEGCDCARMRARRRELLGVQGLLCVARGGRVPLTARRRSFLLGRCVRSRACKVSAKVCMSAKWCVQSGVLFIFCQSSSAVLWFIKCLQQKVALAFGMCSCCNHQCSVECKPRDESLFPLSENA